MTGITDWDDMPGDLANEISDLGAVASDFGVLSDEMRGADLERVERLAQELITGAQLVLASIRKAKP